MDVGIPGIGDAVIIGTGGFSTVYRARMIAFDRTVAVKVLSTPMTDQAAERRFRRELALTARLSREPGVARVSGSGTTASGLPYLLMDYHPGGSLAEYVVRNGPMPVDRALEIGVLTAMALAAAHAHGVLHRDVKPANILIDAFGDPVLSDFGIAGLAGGDTSLTAAFTLQFSAPETLEDDGQSSPAADQYSLGMTIYALLVGGAPWASVVRRQRAPAPEWVPAAFLEVIDRAAAEDPASRWPCVSAFAAALQGVQGQLGLPVTTTRKRRVPRTAAPSATPSAGRRSPSEPPLPPAKQVPADPAPSIPSGPRPGRRRAALVSSLVLALVAATVVGFAVLVRSGQAGLPQAGAEPLPATKAAEGTASPAETPGPTQPQVVRVPTVVGMTESEAANWVKAYGLTPRVTRRAGGAVGIVYEQSPTTGLLRPGEVVSLVVAATPEPTTVRGRVQAAVNALKSREGRGLQWSEPLASADKGWVIAQITKTQVRVFRLSPGAYTSDFWLKSTLRLRYEGRWMRFSAASTRVIDVRGARGKEILVRVKGAEMGFAYGTVVFDDGSLAVFRDRAGDGEPYGWWYELDFSRGRLVEPDDAGGIRVILKVTKAPTIFSTNP